MITCLVSLLDKTQLTNVDAASEESTTTVT